MARWTLERGGIVDKFEGIDQLLAELVKLPSKADPNLDLIHESGDRLSILVRDQYALLRFTQASQDPPYLSASMTFDHDDPNEEYFEFLVADTPTPVPKDRCIPLETMQSIAEHFYSEEELPKWISWVED